jgi:anti-sigma factor (TIGR02949 family)
MTGMSCEDAVRRFFAYLDRALSGEDIEALEAHLEACLDCCDRLQFSRRLDAFVRARLGKAPLPPGIEERVRKALAAAAPAGEEP